MKVLKVILFCILGLILAGMIGIGGLCVVVGMFGMFETLSTNYPDIYAFTVVILIGLVLFKVGWLFFETLIKQHS